MPKLNQVIALTSGKKTRAQKAITEVYHVLQKTEPLSGIARSYRPKDEEGEQLPPEKKYVQVKIKDLVDKFCMELEDLFDVVFAQDQANCEAKADVKVDGHTILADVPVTYLLFLEKQLVDVHTFVEKMPTLDPAESWRYDEGVDCWATEPSQTTRTKKVLRNHVMAEPTKEHPAQVQVYQEDQIVGTWTTVKFSGAIPAREKNEILVRVRRLQEAVKLAREEANNQEANFQKVGGVVFAYLFSKV